jgi:hypothetical protein
MRRCLYSLQLYSLLPLNHRTAPAPFAHSLHHLFVVVDEAAAALMISLAKSLPSPDVAHRLSLECSSLETMRSITSPVPRINLVRPVCGSTTSRIRFCNSRYSPCVIGPLDAARLEGGGLPSVVVKEVVEVVVVAVVVVAAPSRMSLTCSFFPLHPIARSSLLSAALAFKLHRS